MEQIENYFNRIAKEFDLHYTGEKSLFDKIINKIFREDVLRRRMEGTIDEIKEDIKGKSVLDIGTGPGHYSIILSKMGARVTASDISEEMIARAKENARKSDVKNIKFITGNFLNSKLDKKYDYSLAIGFADYTGKMELERLLLNMKEITKKKFIVSFPKLFAFQTPIRKLWLYARNCPVYFYTKHDLAKLFKRLGLRYKFKDCDVNILAMLEK